MTGELLPPLTTDLSNLMSPCCLHFPRPGELDKLGEKSTSQEKNLPTSSKWKDKFRNTNLERQIIVRNQNSKIFLFQEIELKRPASNPSELLGLTLCYEDEDEEGNTEIFLDDIHPLGLAAKDGRLRLGDQIIQVRLTYSTAQGSNPGL